MDKETFMNQTSFSIQSLPWKPEEIIDELEKFYHVYLKRPIQNNDGGQLAAQLFYSWFVAKKMQPEFIIESGIWKGQGTWAFEQACPQAQLVCLDPYPKYFDGYVSKKAIYLHQDFSAVNWNKINKNKTLCFFDDHQDAVERIKNCKSLDFKFVMFEDNYPPGQGDCKSLKKLFESSEEEDIRNELLSYIKVYQEMPPIYDIPKNRWGLDWKLYRSNPPLLKEVTTNWQKQYYQDMLQYTWINYIEI